MVTLATPSHFPPLTEEQLKTSRETGYLEFGSGRRVRREFFEDIQGYDICEEVRKIHCPILIIHGSEDEVVPPENAVEIYENANEPKRLEMIEGGNHVFDDPEHLERVVNLSLEWLKRYL